MRPVHAIAAVLALFSPLATAQFSLAPAQPGNAPEQTVISPYAALTLDYIPAQTDLWGVTLAPTHFDPNYPRWGYYAGYAWGRTENLNLPEPEQGEVSETMGRFGVSYGLTPAIHLYGGAAYHTTKTRYTDGKTQFCADCEPTWTTDKDYRWGAELGMRVNLGQHLVIGAGYNWASESAVISLGLR
ncbi:outer membrane beta-barrel protein [Ferrimonas balearica]|uniref:outer membrane beta-barrel protein n=1 Tax=Ferrimonas balearica TaxID=44012 RepID=UPI001C98EF28|nr:outer membrane beta-barrel protein [Ferrimonas balearica]MBY5992530.1 outer membrane beta-barrel protein [Ferrimonas balearica]